MLTPPAVEDAMRVLARAIGGHPPSDGAHRLAWHLAESGDAEAEAERVARGAGVSPAVLERFLRGDVEPGDFERDAIKLATLGGRRGAVLAGDWGRGGPLGWMDAPKARERAA